MENSWNEEESESDTKINAWETLKEVPFSNAQNTESVNKSEQELTNEKAQAIFEQELTNGITNVEELRHLAEIGTEQIRKDSLEFEGKTIEVLRVSGLPMKFLKHHVNSHEVRKNPSIWAKKASEFKSFNHGVTGSAFDPNREGSASNIISSTYVDTDLNPDMLRGNAYIFTKIRPQSILAASSGDAWTTGDMGNGAPNFVGRGRDFSTPSDIAKQSSGTQLNEVVVKRYDDSGNPLLPTAILSFSLQGNSSIADDSLRAAAYFGIPIIEANLDSYPGAVINKSLNPQEELVDDMAEDDWGGGNHIWTGNRTSKTFLCINIFWTGHYFVIKPGISQVNKAK